MEPGTIALLTATVILVTALIGLLATIHKSMSELNKDVSEIHVIVNGHAKAQIERIEQLAQALRDAGVSVPDNPE